MTADDRQPGPTGNQGSNVDQSLGSRYVLQETLGRGAMGQVFAGTVRETGDRVAIKILKPELVSDPEAVARFMQERQILTSIRNPNVVRVIDLVAEGETLAIVMELIEGQDLRRYLRQQPTLPPAEAIRLLIQLLYGLAAVHAAGVVHRDVKPENLLLDTSASRPMLKLTDFGVARLSYGASLTKLSSLIGTPEYMAPELAESESASQAADLYSAGIVLYEMLARPDPLRGRPPTGHPSAAGQPSSAAHPSDPGKPVGSDSPVAGQRPGGSAAVGRGCRCRACARAHGARWTARAASDADGRSRGPRRQPVSERRVGCPGRQPRHRTAPP